MKIEQQLIENGYFEWEDPDEFTLERCDKFYQKVVYKEGNRVKLYFINAYLMDWANKPYSSQVPDSLKEDLSASFEVQFAINDNDVFDVTYSTKDVKEVEEFLHKMYVRMECTPYDG